MVSAVVALLAAIASQYEIGLFPPKLERSELQIGAASTHAIVDPPGSRADRPGIDDLATYDEMLGIVERAGPLAQLMISPRVVERIGQRVGLDPDLISADTQITNVPRNLTEPDSERRADQILKQGDPYRLEVQARPDLPLLDIYTQAPSADQAIRFADASVAAFNEYLRERGRKRAVPRADQVHLTQLGAARGGPVDANAPIMIAGLTFLVVFGLSCGLLAVFGGIRPNWTSGAEPRPEPNAGPEANARVGPESGGGDWPNTTRPLPWLIAAFIAMLWLVPFNVVAIDVSLPIDLKLDRLVLPVLLVAWVAAMIRQPGGPKWVFTPIHAGIAVFAAVAGLSVVLNAQELNQTLVLGLSIKKLSLLAAYVSLFLVVASGVRRSEVPAFLKLILGLAVVCGLGVIWEYRFGYNVFYDLTARIAPGFFDVPTIWGGFDDLGRREVTGPTQLGLETVAILSMALPIAIVGLMDSRAWRGRLLYGVAVCVIGVAMFATFRKSALVAPFAVGLTVAYFRPRAALKIAPVAVVAALVLAASFDAFHAVTGQFSSDRLDVPTVGDRVADYDAVRPDVLSHPAFGRGFGSYEHTYAPSEARILDSDLLLRVVETGIVGLAAFLLMIGTVIRIAARLIRSDDPSRAPPALAIAAAASAFVVLSALFDEWSFPHAVYVFLALAGLLAVLARSDDGGVPTDPDLATPLSSSEPIRVTRERDPASVATLVP